MPMLNEKEFGEPIWYLEDSDFDQKGNLIAKQAKGYSSALIMFQGNFCGHCTKAKPSFQQAAEVLNKKGVFIGTINIDGTSSEKALANRLKKLPQFQFDGSVPHYVKLQGGQVIVYEQGRDAESFRNSVQLLNA